MDIPAHLQAEIDRVCKAHGIPDDAVYDLMKVVDEIVDWAANMAADGDYE